VSPAEKWSPDRLPTGIELLTRSALRSVTAPLKFGGLALRSAPALARVVAGISTRELRIPLRVPRTRFNGSVSAHRVFDGRAFALDDFKAIKNAVPGTTVNDVVVTVCGGALRKYLHAKNELPRQSLVAMAPMSIRPEAARTSAGNLVSAMALPVRSDIDDPLERLSAVSVDSSYAKKLAHTMGPDLTANLAEFLPSTISGLLARSYAASRLSDRLPPLFNTVITNVPGANVPLYSMGSRMVASYGLGPVVHGIGLFQPILSYDNTITISAVADRAMMPDPAFYCDCIQSAFDELKAATACA
jgi:WS/DGAT/MGAT family acyltransferase